MWANCIIFIKLHKLNNNHSLGENSPNLGPIFRTFFPGKISGKISGKIPRKIFPQNCWEKMEFSAGKVLKNRFSKKFHGK
jgi:hypothetical protein